MFLCINCVSNVKILSSVHQFKRLEYKYILEGVECTILSEHQGIFINKPNT